MGANASRKKVVLVGFCGAGAGTYMRSINGPDGVTTIMPVIAHLYNVVETRAMKLTYWLIGGSDKITAFNKPYLDECDCVLLFFNSTQDFGVEQIRNDFFKLLKQLNRDDVPVLLVLTRADQDGARPPEEIEKELRMEEISPATPRSTIVVNTNLPEEQQKITQWIETSHELLPTSNKPVKSALK